MIAAPLNQSGMQVAAVADAVLVEYVPCTFTVARVVIHDPTGAGGRVTLLVNAIILTVDGVPGHGDRTALVVAGAVPVADTGGGLDPSPAGKTALLKDKGNALIGNLFTVKSCVGSLIKIVPIVTDGLPAVQQLAAHHVVGLIAHDLQTRAFVDLAAIADQLIADNIVFVADGGEGRTPLNGRAAGGTEYSSRIAGTGSGGRLGRRRTERMLMEAHSRRDTSVDPCLRARHAVSVGAVEEQLGIHQNILHAEGTESASLVGIGEGDLTRLQGDLNALRPEDAVLHQVGRSGFGRLIHPRTDGDGGQRGVSDGFIITGAGDDDSRYIVVCLNGVGSGEALGQCHALKLPARGVIEVKDQLDLLNGLQLRGGHVQPVERADEQPVCVRIARRHRNGRSRRTALHVNRCGDPRRIFLVILDTELYGMEAVGQHHVGGNDLARAIDTADLNAVHKDLSGIGRDT